MSPRPKPRAGLPFGVGDAVAAFALGAVEGRVGALHQRWRVTDRQADPWKVREAGKRTSLWGCSSSQSGGHRVLAPHNVGSHDDIEVRLGLGRILGGGGSTETKKVADERAL